MQRVDPVLFTLSRDYVGDTAETASLLWPGPEEATDPPTVSEAVDALAHMTRLSALGDLAALLDRLDAAGRFTLLKLATGARPIGRASSRGRECRSMENSGGAVSLNKKQR